MTIKVTVQKEECFENDEKIEQQFIGGGHYNKMDDLLKEGKRCFITCRGYSSIVPDFPVTDLMNGDELFWVDGDCWEKHIGTVCKVEEE
ncbi:hypothetical protein UFOVP276_202 [uncultured Caudovirales phage]|uniref:Uncharacterized protein n=1 Tax=uncultured Caudovirales phage TaxID=2100421 RepID=A0A6J5LQQ3_9CAUD|nr:hypothetical protein UFOVP127_96 [uncultured Caudovirales phage]CAB4135246.1 hypothetical protein UFOVP276_202 [uncultured Caudovirales phage]